MGEFVKGWRRKVGCVTLMLACVFMAVWVRSTQVEDILRVKVGSSNGVVIASSEGSLFGYVSEQATMFRELQFMGLSWDSRWIGDSKRSFFSAFRQRQIRSEFCGSGIAICFGEGAIYSTLVRVSLLWIIVPLTVLSAWLFLGKPRKKLTSS